MKEPIFLEEIHQRHLQEYAKNRDKTLDERLRLIQERANSERHLPKRPHSIRGYDT